ncbi:NPCBM/NEW2 domain-containing protein [Lentisphaera profundi]|uniref:NPCBM/NEW2 domain-containing protein n=1 Tax=Lentisphaera profundi TaxID=1658616 RepID=A0ABY7VRQ2_9BACT|nr:NPCBM/NEW2 domain-containing protein [Lentisphaera profundi]WDE96409.1 NPCBM/NEW2 domain-containing protein [Lentisphaera profundi]
MNQHQIQLIERYQDDELSENELNEFLQLLEEDNDFRSEASAALEIKGLLKLSQHPKTDNLEQEVLSKLECEDNDLENRVLEELHQDKTRRFPKWLIPALVAQVLLIPAFFFMFQQPAHPELKIATKPALMAHVKTLEGYSFIVRGKEKLNPTESTELFSGDHIYVQDKSKLKLSYLDDSTLTFFDSSFVRLSEIEGQKKIELFSGQISADVKPQKKKMLVTTEHSTAEVLGTVFSISSSDVSSLLDVREGTVRFDNGHNSVMVSAQHYATTEQGQVLKALENDRPIYKSPLVDLTTPNHMVPIKVDIKGASKLYLVVSNGGDNNRFDHGAWISPIIKGPAGSLSLAEIPWNIAKSGAYGITINQGVHQTPLKVEGQLYEQGILAHATSIIAWDIPDGYDQFEAMGALLDSGAYRKHSNPVPSMYFEVYTSMPEKKLKTLLIRRHHY